MGYAVLHKARRTVIVNPLLCRLKERLGLGSAQQEQQRQQKRTELFHPYCASFIAA